MARTECVSHATKCWFWKFHLDYYAITDYDHCAASLLYIFEFLTDNALGDINKSPDDIDVWITITKSGLSDAIVEMFSDRSAFNALKKLEAIGFLNVREQTALGETKQYRFNYEKVSESIVSWVNSPRAKKDRTRFNTFAGKISYETPQAKFPTAPQEEFPTDGRQNFLLYKEECISLETVDKDITKNPLSLIDQTQTPPIPEQPLELEEKTSPPPAADFETQSTLQEYSTLQLEEDITVFVKNAYTQSRGAKITNALLKRYTEVLIREEANYSPEEFRAALWSFLADSTPWLRENKWPLGRFMQTVQEYLPQANSPATRFSAPQAPSTSSDAPAIAPAQSLVTHLTLVDEWNTLISEAQCGTPLKSWDVKNVENAIKNPEFMEVWNEVLAKCRYIATNRPDVGATFTWLFTSTQAGPQWQSIASGKFDWATKPKNSGAGLSVADALVEKLEKEERGITS